jgi:hypothetical protein
VSSAHTGSHGCSASTPCAPRISRSVQGRAAQSGPQLTDRGVTTPAQSAVRGGVANSRSVESWIFTRTG